MDTMICIIELNCPLNSLLLKLGVRFITAGHGPDKLRSHKEC